MKFLGLAVYFAVFSFATYRCGKSIDKRYWSEAVAEFLFALGVILILVKGVPSPW
jgi:hypothetical protein